METQNDSVTKFEPDSADTVKHTASSAYLWRGFSGDLGLTTFNLFTKVNIIDVALGDTHNLFLTDGCQAFVSGSNDMGQLGIGSLEILVMEEPVKLTGVSEPVVQIACGRHHSAVVTDAGQVYCWGQSKDGQCGTGSLSLVLSPTQAVVEINKGFCQHGVPKPTVAVAINSVACGASHTLAVSNDGEVWGWGCGPQLGLDDLRHAPVPRRIEAFQGQAVVSVCCGDRHSMALVLREENSSSRSSSPMKSKGKTEAKSVLENEHYPSRCSVCNKEIYTYTDTSDMCVIDTLHDCNVNDSILSVDSTIIEDVSSSSSSEVAKRSATASPDEEVEPTSKIKHENEEALTQERKSTAGDSKSHEDIYQDRFPGDCSLLETSGLDMSILVIPAENLFEGDDLNSYADNRPGTSVSIYASSEYSNPLTLSEIASTENDQIKCTSSVKDGDGSILETHFPVSEATKSDSEISKCKIPFEEEISENGDKKQKLSVAAIHTEHRRGSLTRTLSTESSDTLLMMSESEELDEELRTLMQGHRKRSPSTTSVKSFDLSGAREYLQRQLEDKNDTDTLDKIYRSSVKNSLVAVTTGQNGIPPVSVKTVASSTVTHIQTSGLASSCGLPEVSSTYKDSSHSTLSSVPAKTEKQESQTKEKSSDFSRHHLSQNCVSTATDVLVWGYNEHGQLGLGDQLDRAHPTLLKVFVGRHVIKLAAGEKHNLALTANSQVYSWGSNSYGQLGQAETVLVPSRIKFPNTFTTWDIAAGVAHSAFLGDVADTDKHPDILYCGKHPSKDIHASLKKTNSPASLVDIKQLGWVTKVMAGGTWCACKVLNPAPPESEAVFELAATEREFYNQLIKTSNLLLRPLQKSNFYTSMGVYPYKSALRTMVVTFGALTKKIGEGITDLTRCIQEADPPNSTQMLGCHSQFVEAFRTYSQSFSDFLAVGGFDYCTRTGSDFFEKIQSSIKDLSNERDKSAASNSLFMRAMKYPFLHMAEYIRIITKIAAVVTIPDVKTSLQNLVLDWDGLKIKLLSEHNTADATRAFWETAIPKLADSLRIPDRRLLRESKTHPLHMPSGGRFTNRLFVLFNDTFLMQTTSMALFTLETVWVESDGEHPNAITILSPEEKLDLVASTPTEKAEWLIILNSAISKVLTSKKSLPCRHGSGERFTPPLIRHASHTFVKHGAYKDATYSGSWLSGKIHGTGSLKWSDGSVFEGNFKKGLMHGSGTFTLVKSKGNEVQKGNWKDGKLNGLATVNYANGDLYEGHFQDGQRFGHGKYQSGRHKSSCVTAYIGEWLGNMKDGYGVQDDILKGEKYMGMWMEDQRNGCGVMVTLDGMYFEGNFVQNRLTGFGVMISDDNTTYEGDFVDVTHLSGKGTLTLSSGDKLEGTFSGTLNEGLKINGTFIKSTSSPDFDLRPHPVGASSKHFGHLGVSADNKWTDIFCHAKAVLGQSSLGKGLSQEDTDKAWEVVTVMVASGRHILKEGTGISPSKLKVHQRTLEDLETIPVHDMAPLNTEMLEELSAYLAKACDTIYHPLGQLMENLVDVFRASYIGIGAHPRLLHHAVLEMRSYINRLYQVARILFPALPVNGGPLYVYPPTKFCDIPRTINEVKEYIEDLETDGPNVHVFTAGGLLYPILLPKIYPPLFDLYVLYNEKSDDRYWERVTKLNRQSDMGLMAYLGIEQRFWLMEDILQHDKTQTLSTIKDVCYAEAVDTLQQLSTAFSPTEKLKIIEQTFDEITKTVALTLKDDHVWCMDDLFPVFQFVVVRAKIHHLCAEIHMIDDMMEPYMEHGELGLMFTTLKACYFQIQNEKLPHH